MICVTYAILLIAFNVQPIMSAHDVPQFKMSNSPEVLMEVNVSVAIFQIAVIVLDPKYVVYVIMDWTITSNQ